MATKIGTIYALITGDKRPLDKALVGARKSAVSGAKKIQTALNKINFKAVALSAAAMGTAIGFFMKKAIDAASDLEEVTAKYGTVFGEQVKIANKWVKILVADYAMSTREARFYLGAMQDLLVPMGMNAVAAAKMSNEVVKLAADLGSFNNLRTEDVMRDIQSALVGNFETMQKYGVILNQAVIVQKALDMGLISNKKQLDANKRAQVAYQLIVEGSTFAIGDMARTSGGYANTLKKMKSQIESAMGAIGTGLLPAAVKIVSEMSNWIEKNQEFINQDLPNFLTKIAGGMGSIIKALAGVSEAERLKIQLDSIKVSIQEISESKAPGKNRMLEALNFALHRTENKLYSLATTWDETTRKIFDSTDKLNEKIDDISIDIKLDERPSIDPGSTAQWAEEKLKKEIDISNREIEIEKQKQREIDELRAQAKMDEVELAEEKLRDYIEMSNAEIEIEKEKSAFMIKLSERTAWSMQSTFSDLFFDAMKGEFKSLEDYATAIFDSILRSATDILSQQVVEGLFGSILKSGGGGLFESITGIFSGRMGGPTSTIRGGQGGGYGFQHGGYIGEGITGMGRKSGKSYEFHPNEFVTPAGKFGGSNVDVIINNNTGQQASVRESQGPGGLRQIFVMIGNDVKSGGPIASAFEQTYDIRRSGRTI